MMNSPSFSLFAVAVMIWLGAQHWRRNRLRRAVRDLPTAMRRLLGPEPDFAPPSRDALPEGLRAYAAVHRRTGRVQRALWGLALLWLAYVTFLVLRKQFP